jgi:hypothetical protein
VFTTIDQFQVAHAFNYEIVKFATGSVGTDNFLRAPVSQKFAKKWHSHRMFFDQHYQFFLFFVVLLFAIIIISGSHPALLVTPYPLPTET